MPRTSKEIYGLGLEHEVRFSRKDEDNEDKFLTASENDRINGNVTDAHPETIAKYGRIIGEVHIDQSVMTGVECVTHNWKHSTVEKTISQLRYTENVILKRIRREINTNFRKHPYGIIAMGENSATGMGSYHIGITLPTKKSEMGEKYGRKALKFLKQFRWMQPLLLANYSSPRVASIGDFGDYSEGSERATSTGWGNAGGVNLNDLYEGRGERREGKTPKWRVMIDAKGSIVKNPEGSGISNQNCMASDIDTGQGHGTRTSLKTMNTDEFPPRMELRFMDDFDSSAIPSLLKTIVYTAANATETNPDFNADVTGFGKGRLFKIVDVAS